MKGTRFISLLLGGALLITWPQPSQAGPSAPSQSLKPRGVRLLVRSVISVTDSEDGFKDNTVEVYGRVNFNGEKVWSLEKKDAVEMTKDRRNILFVAERTFDVIYNQPSTWTLSVNGYINDRDTSGSDDVMWNPGNRTHLLKIKQFTKKNRIGALTLAGDRKNESADLVFAIHWVSDIF